MACANETYSYFQFDDDEWIRKLENKINPYGLPFTLEPKNRFHFTQILKSRIEKDPSLQLNGPPRSSLSQHEGDLASRIAVLLDERATKTTVHNPCSPRSRFLSEGHNDGPWNPIGMSTGNRSHAVIGVLEGALKGGGDNAAILDDIQFFDDSGTNITSLEDTMPHPGGSHPSGLPHRSANSFIDFEYQSTHTSTMHDGTEMASADDRESVYSNPPDSSLPPDCKQKNACIHCGKAFRYPSKLKDHLITHSDNKTFSCRDCGKQFKRGREVKAHVTRCPKRKAAKGGSTSSRSAIADEEATEYPPPSSQKNRPFNQKPPSIEPRYSSSRKRLAPQPAHIMLPCGDSVPRQSPRSPRIRTNNHMQATILGPPPTTNASLFYGQTVAGLDLCQEFITPGMNHPHYSSRAQQLSDSGSFMPLLDLQFGSQEPFTS